MGIQKRSRFQKESEFQKEIWILKIEYGFPKKTWNQDVYIPNF